jgi:hypothetical protein
LDLARGPGERVHHEFRLIGNDGSTVVRHLTTSVSGGRGGAENNVHHL